MLFVKVELNRMELNLFFRHAFKRVTAYIKTAGDATRKDGQSSTKYMEAAQQWVVGRHGIQCHCSKTIATVARLL